MPKKPPAPPQNDHPQHSSGEIGAEMASLNEMRRQLVAEGAALYLAHQTEPGLFQPMSEREKAVREHVAHLLNGSTPPEYLVPKAAGRDQQIQIQKDAIDHALHILGRRHIDAKYRESDQWVAAHGAEWRDLARDIVSTATRLHALEERARDLIKAVEPGTRGLVMAQHIGGASSFLGVGNPLGEMTKDALDQGVITKSEIREAQNV